MPKVSIIIPCYNLGQYLDEAVNSVLDQTFQDYEIIIVNDGSTDKFTNTLLRNYSKPKCTIYTTDNQGLPATRNYGIEKSSGKYLSCLDADDKYHPEFLDKCVNILDQDIKGEIGFITTWAKIFGDDEFIWETAEYDPYKLFIENQIHVASVFKKNLWEEVRGYSTNLTGYQDWDFWLKIITKGYEWRVVKEPLFLYRKRSNSMISVSDEKRADLRKEILQSNSDFLNTNAANIILEYDKLLEKLIKNHSESNKKIQKLQNEILELNVSKAGLEAAINDKLVRLYKIVRSNLKRLRELF